MLKLQDLRDGRGKMQVGRGGLAFLRGLPANGKCDNTRKPLQRKGFLHWSSFAKLQFMKNDLARIASCAKSRNNCNYTVVSSNQLIG